MKLKKAWYIINYHNIDWSDNDFLTSFNLTTSPSLLREQMIFLSNHGKLVSFSEGLKLFQSNLIKEPIISFSFDDGYLGVYKYAKKVLNDFNISGLTSVCSNFYRHEELFWRLKLSYINNNGGNRFVRTKLKKLGFNLNKNRISKFTLDKFNSEIIEIINQVFKYYRINEKKISEDIFMNIEQIKNLAKDGWEVGNHSTNHYPYSEGSYIHNFVNDFRINNKRIKEDINFDCKLITLPFERWDRRSKKIQTIIDEFFREFLVIFVGNKKNYSNKIGNIYRFASTNERPERLLKFMCS